MSQDIPTITRTEDLARFCEAAKLAPYVTVDTEFLRERTYWSKLCLIQLAIPPASTAKTGGGDAVLVDPLSEELSLEPLYDLFRHEATVKVFHAARQDLEIFYHDAQLFPVPLFDTQVAAMVCGFGEQVGYETLVRKIARADLDKSSRFTDWSRRPLSDAQAAYALADVTHLRVIYEYLSAELKKTGARHGWPRRSRSWRTPRRISPAPKRPGSRCVPAPTRPASWRSCANWRGSARPMPRPATSPAQPRLQG